jgi:Helix-turn-helix domain
MFENTTGRKIDPTTRKIQETQRMEILHDAYYSVGDLSSRSSPYYIASEATIYRWIARGDLVPCRQGRRNLIKGSAIHALLSGQK